MAEPATESEAALSVPAQKQPDTPTPPTDSPPASQQSSLTIADTLKMVEKFCPIFAFHPKVQQLPGTNLCTRVFVSLLQTGEPPRSQHAAP